MKTNWILNKTVMAAFLIIAMTSVSFAQKKADKYKAEIETLKSELAKIAKTNEIIAKNLETFDELDFVVFTNEEWARLHESHSKDILVHWPDGSTTKGI